MRRASEMPWVERMIQVGIRGIGGSGGIELERARDWGARIVTAQEAKQKGIECALDHVDAGSRCVITIDATGLIPQSSPA